MKVTLHFRRASIMVAMNDGEVEDDDEGALPPYYGNRS